MPHDPPHDPPTEDVLDAPLVGVKLNEQWWSHVIGLTSVAARASYWASDHERGEESMQQLLDLLAKGNAPVFDPLSARVRRTTNQSILNNTNTVLIFDTEVWDVGGLFDIASPTLLTLPDSGPYAVGCNIRWQGNVNGYRELSIFRTPGGAVVSSRRSSQSSKTNDAIHTIFNFDAGDVIFVVVRQNSGVSLNLEPWQEATIDFYAHYLGPI